MIIALPKIIDVFASASVNIMPGRNTFLAGQQALRAEGAYQWLSSFEASFSDSGIHRNLRLEGPSDRSGEDIPEAVPGNNPKSGIANPIREISCRTRSEASPIFRETPAKVRQSAIARQRPLRKYCVSTQPEREIHHEHL
jgi:hypothetical protein